MLFRHRIQLCTRTNAYTRLFSSAPRLAFCDPLYLPPVVWFLLWIYTCRYLSCPAMSKVVPLCFPLYLPLVPQTLSLGEQKPELTKTLSPSVS